jgi:hypothetical protein
MSQYRLRLQQKFGNAGVSRVSTKEILPNYTAFIEF